MKKSHKHMQGFTLIELMIVVAIISILATLALPRFQTFQAKAKRTEAVTNLRVVLTLAETHHVFSGEYAGFSNPVGNPAGNHVSITAGIDCSDDILGFSLANCEKANYLYESSGSVSSFGATFVARAPADIIVSGCQGLTEDTQTIAVPDQAYYNSAPRPWVEGGVVYDAIKFCN
jgi:prepilin-type N-terminal cleavage/methylation domain-containing protein